MSIATIDSGWLWIVNIDSIEEDKLIGKGKHSFIESIEIVRE